MECQYDDKIRNMETRIEEHDRFILEYGDGSDLRELAKHALQLAKSNQEAITNLIILLRGEKDDHASLGLLGAFAKNASYIATIKRVSWFIILGILAMLLDSTTGLLTAFIQGLK